MRRYIFEKTVKYQLVKDVSDTSNDNYDTLMSEVEHTPLDEWKIINHGDDELKSINSMNKGYADFDEFLEIKCNGCGRLIHEHSRVKQIEVIHSKDTIQYVLEYTCNCGYNGGSDIVFKK